MVANNRTGDVLSNGVVGFRKDDCNANLRTAACNEFMKTKYRRSFIVHDPKLSR